MNQNKTLYNKYLEYLSTEKSVIATAKIDGIIATAQKMKAKGFTNDIIADLTDLSIDIIETL
jgi:hypothetical protein